MIKRMTGQASNMISFSGNNSILDGLATQQVSTSNLWGTSGVKSKDGFVSTKAASKDKIKCDIPKHQDLLYSMLNIDSFDNPEVRPITTVNNFGISGLNSMCSVAEDDSKLNNSSKNLLSSLHSEFKIMAGDFFNQEQMLGKPTQVVYSPSPLESNIKPVSAAFMSRRKISQNTIARPPLPVGKSHEHLPAPATAQGKRLRKDFHRRN